MGDDSTSLGGKDWRGWAVGADMCVTAPACSNHSVKAACLCAESRFMAGGLAFLSSTEAQGPLSPAVFVFGLFLSSCKNS